MKKLKYPQNIIVLISFLILCFGIIFYIIGQSNSILPVKSQNNAFTKPISSEAKFRFTNIIVFGSKQKPISINKLLGTGKIKLDLASGNIYLSSINFQELPFRIQFTDKNVKISTIKLDPNYLSTGKVNLQTGKIDLSVGIVLEMKIDSSDEKVSLVLPLVGTLNGQTGMLNLNGAVTIPPDKLEIPLPAEVSIKAVSL